MLIDDSQDQYYENFGNKWKRLAAKSQTLKYLNKHWWNKMCGSKSMMIGDNFDKNIVGAKNIVIKAL